MTLKKETIYSDTKTKAYRDTIEYPDGSGMIIYSPRYDQDITVSVHDYTPNGIGFEIKTFSVERASYLGEYLNYVNSLNKKFEEYNDKLEENQIYKTPGQRLAEIDSKG